MTVTIPGRRQEIAKRIGRKVQPPQVFMQGCSPAVLMQFGHTSSTARGSTLTEIVLESCSTPKTPTTTCTHTVAICSAMCAQCLPKCSERSSLTFLGRSSRPTAFA